MYKEKIELLNNYLKSGINVILLEDFKNEIFENNVILDKNSAVCGHYEGIDARILNFIDEEVSIGDYVLMGGEVPAMTILEAVSRLVPGVISEDSPVNESFSDSLLEHPQYTRPAIYEGLGVPDVLLSGHHANIKKWQREKALEKTLKVRPDLLKKANLDLNDYKYLWELKNEKN